MIPKAQLPESPREQSGYECSSLMTDNYERGETAPDHDDGAVGADVAGTPQSGTGVCGVQH
jgi:hypothetical protein